MVPNTLEQVEGGVGKGGEVRRATSPAPHQRDVPPHWPGPTAAPYSWELCLLSLESSHVHHSLLSQSTRPAEPPAPWPQPAPTLTASAGQVPVDFLSPPQWGASQEHEGGCCVLFASRPHTEQMLTQCLLNE